MPFFDLFVDIYVLRKYTKLNSKFMENMFGAVKGGVLVEDYIKRIFSNKNIPAHMKEVVGDEIYHGIEVSNLAVLIAKELGEDEKFCEELTVAGVLHDIGKMKLARYLFSEEDDTLVVEHIKYVRMHSTHSYDILKKAGYSENIIQAVYHHHENYDGSGYPDNLRGDSIPKMARILRTCDVFSALTSNRSYRKAFDEKSAVEIMIDEVADYDMRVFLAFQRILHNGVYPGIMALRKTISDLQMEQIKLFEIEVLAD